MMEKHEFYFMNYIFASKIVFKHVLFSAHFDLYSKYFFCFEREMNIPMIRAMHTPTMHVVFFLEGGGSGW